MVVVCKGPKPSLLLGITPNMSFDRCLGWKALIPQVTYINYVLIRMTQKKSEIHDVLRAALEDLAADKTNDVEKPIDAKQFNEIGIAAKQVQLNSCSILLYWLVCIIEWQSGHRIFLSFMSELIRRTADLLNEADSTNRSLKTHITALQAQASRGSVEDDGSAGGVPEVAPETSSRVTVPVAPPVTAPVVGLAVITSAAAAEARIAAAKAVLEEIDKVKKEAEKLQANLLKNKISSPDTIEADAQGFPDFKRILEFLQKAGVAINLGLELFHSKKKGEINRNCTWQAQPKTLEDAKSAAKCGGGGASRAREIYGETYAALETKLLQLQLKGRQALKNSDKRNVVFRI